MVNKQTSRQVILVNSGGFQKPLFHVYHVYLCIPNIFGFCATLLFDKEFS
jgi:hypothetical protein